MGNLKIVNDRDRDWPIKTVGITGLKKNFGRDGGIEEPYWGPSSRYYNTFRLLFFLYQQTIRSENTLRNISNRYM